MRKILCLIIAISFFISLSNACIDLDNNQIGYEDIIELKENGVALGYPDNTFRPNNHITEQELITILFRASNLEICKDFNNWPSDYIQLGISNGIIADESLVTRDEFLQFVDKISILPKINNKNEYFDNGLSGSSYSFKKLENSKYITRAEACMNINKLLKLDGKITTKDLPQKTEVYYQSDKTLDITTVIKSIETFDYDLYDGKYLDTINLIKTGQHPYLNVRNKNAKGNKIIAVEFDTQNNSDYGAWTGYKSLKFEGVEVIDAFDLDEINNQLNNLAYDAILVSPNRNYVVTAFYIVDELPEELCIKRDVNTLYNLQTHGYVDVNCFSIINIRF